LMVLTIAMMVTGAQPSQAQNGAGVGHVLAGLINADVASIALALQNTNVNVANISLVNVQNALNENQIRVLLRLLNNSPIASNNSNFLTYALQFAFANSNWLNNLAQNANILNNNVIVVGVLGGAIFVLPM